MKAIIKFSLKQKVFYNLLFVLLTVAGFFAMSQLPTERYPNINFGEVNISTFFPGASPVEVETLVTRKLEEALESVANIEWLSATSYPERSHIRLKFVDDTDYDALYNEVRLKVLNMSGELPETVDPPEMDSATVEDFLPVIVINLGGDHNNRALSLMAEDVKSSLSKVPDVKEVKISGEFVREFHIYLEPFKLRRHGVSFDDVALALQEANISIPAGDFSNESGDYLVRVDEKFRSRAQVVDTIIRRDGDGGYIRLKDLISDARLSYRDAEVISTVNGNDVISLSVIKTSAGSALKIKESILEALDSLQPMFDQEKLEVTLTQDSTVKIKDGLSTLALNMLVGMVLVSLVIWYFMGLRNAGLVTIGIPFSFMITMLLMYLTGNSLNEISLFAFVLVTGIIVDDAIIVSENIFRHVQEGNDLYDAIIKGASEVALPVISSTITTAAAFLPMLIMSGATGEFFSEVPITVTYALIASLIECILILPIHYLDFGPRHSNKLANRLEKDNFILMVTRWVTDNVLKFTLRFRWLSLIIVFLLLFAAVGVLAISASGKVPLIKIKFFPDDYTLYYADIIGPAATPLSEIDTMVRDVSEFIMADGQGYAESASGFAGFYPNEDYEPVFGNNHGTVMVTMPSKDRQEFGHPLTHLDNMRDRITERFKKEGYTFSIHAQKDGPPTGKDINVRVLGTNFDAIDGLANDILKILKSESTIAPYLVDLDDDRGQPRSIYRFNVRQEKAHEYNLRTDEVARLAASVLDGRFIGKYRLNDEEIDLKLLISPDAIKDPRDALDVALAEDAQRPISLGDVTQLVSYKEQGELNRYQGLRSVSLKANLKPEAPTSSPVIVNFIKDYYRTIQDKYPGASVIFGGEHEDTQRSYLSLAYAFVIAVMIMYIVLAAQFQSYLQPVIILSAIVFALIGVVFGKLVTQSIFTVNSFIAVIGVAGVVVNDSLVLIDFMNKRYQSGLTRRQSIEEGLRIRLRPILLTTLTTTLGLLPMALGIPDYSLVWGSMASTFVTGLATATALTLFIVPVLWDLIMGLQERRLNKPS